MSRNVNLSINSSQDDGEETVEINKTKQGQIYNKQGTLYLRYREDLQDVKNVKTTLKIKEDKLTLIRRGEVSSIQHFIPGEKTTFDYKTPYGNFKFKLEVEEFDIKADISQGEIKLVYALYNRGKSIGVNSLEVSYKELPNNL